MTGHPTSPAGPTPTARLALRDIHQRFPGVIALDNVHLDLHAGRVQA